MFQAIIIGSNWKHRTINYLKAFINKLVRAVGAGNYNCLGIAPRWQINPKYSEAFELGSPEFDNFPQTVLALRGSGGFNLVPSISKS